MTTRLPRPGEYITLCVLAAGAVASVTTGVEPTGTRAVDVALIVAFTALLAGATTVTPPALVIVAAVLLAATGTTAATVCAAAAIAATVWATRRDDPLLRLVAGVLLANAALRLAWPSAFGATALVAATAIALVIAGAAPRLPRRLLLRASLGAFAVAVLACAGAAITLATRQADVRAAAHAADAGIDAARSGETQLAAARFADAEHRLRSLHTALHAWWTRPALAVPVVAQHVRALDELTSVAGDVAGAGVASARASDPDRLRPHAGTIDLAAIRTLQPTLVRLETQLSTLRERLPATRSPWLISPLADQVARLETKADRAQVDVSHATQAATEAPWLLGSDAPRRYALLVMTPSELRSGGGFVGNWGVITASAGHIELTHFARITELYRPTPYHLDVNPDWDARYMAGWRVDRFPQNVLGSPDFPSNAEAFRQILHQAGKGDVDGVIAVDPIAMAALLQLTGPIDVPGWGAPLTSANAAEALLYRQYLDAENPARVELLADTTRSLFDRLTSGSLPAPPTVARTLSPQVAAGHMMMTVFERTHESFLHISGLDHHVEVPTSDSLAVVSANASADKLGWFLRRSVSYDVHTADSGAVTASLDVKLTNTAPMTGLPTTYFGDVAHGYAVGEIRQLVSVYTPFAVVTSTLDGQPVQLGGATEYGLHVYDAFVRLAPGRSMTLHYNLHGTLRRGGYHLMLIPQSTAVPDNVRISIDGRLRREGAVLRAEVLSVPGPTR